MKYTKFALSTILLTNMALAEPESLTQIAPVIEPIGQVVDHTVPAYRPKFMAVAPIAGRFEERRWANINTYPAPAWGYGGIGYGFGSCRFGSFYGGIPYRTSFGY